MTLETSPAAEESIGQRLRRLRLERGLSQRDLASPGVSYAYISRIEAGARRPSVKALRMLAPKLGVSVEYLETGSDLRAADERELRLAAVELLEECMEEVEDGTPESEAVEVRFAAYLSYALTDLGDVDRAQAVLRDV